MGFLGPSESQIGAHPAREAKQRRGRGGRGITCDICGGAAFLLARSLLQRPLDASYGISCENVKLLLFWRRRGAGGDLIRAMRANIGRPRAETR